MVKKLIKVGNNLALVIDRSILEVTKIDADTLLEVSTNGNVIVISPVRTGERAAKLREGVRAINRRYAGIFQHLSEGWAGLPLQMDTAEQIMREDRDVLKKLGE